MYAIVDIAGQQFKVEKKQKLYVHRLEGETGSKVSFEKVLLIENEGTITVGTPVIKDAAVSATLVDHVKGDKVLVFKKKRRKGYRKLNGHRQQFTQIEITDILEKVEKKAAAEKVAEAPKASTEDKAPKATAAKKESEAKPATEKKATAAKPASTAKKTTATKSETAEKKPAAKKPAAKKADKDDSAAEKK